MIKVDFDFSHMEAMFGRIDTFALNDTVSIAAPVVIDEIRKGVREGRGIDGPWKGDAAHYGQQQAARRTAHGLQTETVDLSVTDSYLAGLHREGDAIVPGAGKEGQAEGLNKRRAHLGASEHAYQRLEAEIADGFNKAP